jgi:DNA polymerase-3 subunit epsilon
VFKNLKLTRPLVVFDLETTGTDPATCRLIDLAMTTIWPDGRSLNQRWRVDPEVPIPAEATKVHGITDADVAMGDKFREFAALVSRQLDGCDIAGFNLVRFDLRVLVEEFKRSSVPFSLDGRAIIDAMVLYHKLRPRTCRPA